MSMTDPVADMLTRIRNACTAGHRRVDIPRSKLKAELARILTENHFVADFKVLDDGGRGVLRLYLKYHDERPVIRELRRVSSPGLRRSPSHCRCRQVSAQLQKSAHRWFDDRRRGPHWLQSQTPMRCIPENRQ